MPAYTVIDFTGYHITGRSVKIPGIHAKFKNAMDRNPIMVVGFNTYKPQYVVPFSVDPMIVFHIGSVDVGVMDDDNVAIT